MRDNNTSTTENSCIGSIFWAITLDTWTGGACYGGTGATISCTAGGSSTTTAIVASSSCIGVPIILCAGLLCYKASSGDRTEVRPPIGATFCLNTLPTMFHCGPQEDATESVSLTAPGQATGAYGSTSARSTSTRSVSIN